MKRVIFLIAAIQVILLFGITFADSYQIHQLDKKNDFSGVSGNFEVRDTLKKSLNLLVGFLAIKQIGTVSAEQAGGYCCEKTETGAYCQNTNGPNDCDPAYQNSPTTCDQTTYCQPGCCYDKEQGICFAGSPQKQCTDNEGEWKATCEEEPRCGKGCCILGSNTQFTTRAHCRIISEFQEAQINFDPAMTEEDCKYYSPEEGACLISDGSCRRTAEEECKGLEGNFNKGYLCSYFDTGAGCKQTDHIGCSDKENQYDIFWYDSCGNRENVYLGNSEGAKTTSWAGGMIKKKGELSCSSGKSDCGVCKYEEGESICAQSKSMTDSVQAGDYYCKPLDCEIDKALSPDGKRTKVMNGESWCVYDGASSGKVEGWVGSDVNNDKNQGKNSEDGTLVGVTSSGFYGRDAVGAGHFIRYCDEGEIKTDPCGTGDRGEICSEISYEGGIMRAQCRVNLWYTCFNFQTKEDCVASPNVDCRWQGVSVDDYFKFGVCVPKFPKGFNLKQDPSLSGETESGTTQEQDICSIATQSCTWLEVKECGSFVGAPCEWKCKVNCECKEEAGKFIEEMNNLCVSLGDCGAFVNVEGVYSGKGFASRGEMPNLENYFEKYPTSKNKVEVWNSVASGESQEQTTPVWIPVEGSEGTYGELAGVNGELDPKFKENNYWANIGTAYKVFGGVGAAGGLLSIGFLIGQAGKEAGLTTFWYVGSGGTIPGTQSSTTLAKTNLGKLPGMQQASGYLGAIAILMMGGQLIGQTIGSMIGGGDIQSELGMYGAAAGLAAGITVAILAGSGQAGSQAFVGFFASGVAGPVILAVVAAYMTAQLVWSLTNGNGDTREGKINFKCMPWQPPISTEDDQCKVCNENGLGTPCTKYKCNSLGSGCDLIDQDGATAENPDPNGDNGVNNEIPEISNPVCVDMGKCGYGSGNLPVPELTFVSSGFDYDEVQGGAKVTKDDGKKVRESDIINLTISTDQYAYCKYNYYKRNYATFDSEGELFNEGNYHTMNHTLTITIPWIEDERVQNNSGDSLRLFIRCIDKCDKYVNTAEYVVEFPIDPSPDTTPPLILNVTPSDPTYLPYGGNMSYIEVALNEEGNCKYDYNQGIQYGLMVGGNFTKCSDSTNGEKFCSHGFVTNLVGNSTTIYIKCQDIEGNNNTEDYPHTFLPSPEALKITDYKPDKEHIRKKPITPEEPLFFSVTTAGGAFSGNSECWWKLTGPTVAEDTFLQNQSTTHEYEITSQLNPGEHQIDYACLDSAGNFANLTTKFTIEQDQTPPAVVRVFMEGSNIKVLTNEEARCFYNTTYVPNCNFEDGTGMDSMLTTEHLISYQYDQTYYVKCKDEFEQQNPKCAVIIKPMFR